MTIWKTSMRTCFTNEHAKSEKNNSRKSTLLNQMLIYMAHIYA